MATRREEPKPEQQPEQQAPPAYYIALEPLFVGGQFGRAHNPGDRVPVEHVDRYGWADKVRRPDEDPAGRGKPDEQPAPQNEPETSEGQATTERKGDA